LDININLNLEKFVPKLSLEGEEPLLLVNGGKRENILDDSSTFERMEVGRVILGV
jgi:hypothetical protein